MREDNNVFPMEGERVNFPVVLVLVLLTGSLFGLEMPVVASTVQPHVPILITGDGDFVLANGITSGIGTASNPYVIEGWAIDASFSSGIDVGNTRAHFVIRNVSVHSSPGHNGIYFHNVANGLVEFSSVSEGERGLSVFSSINLVLLGNRLSSNRVGMSLVSSSDLNIAENDVWNNEVGIVFFQSSDSLISRNTISSNGRMGVDIEYSTNATLTENVFTENGVVLFSGSSLSHLNSHTITQDNLVNGKPLYYYRDCTGLNIDGIPVGQLIVVNCDNVRISNLQIAATDVAIEMAFVNYAQTTANVLSSNKLGGILSIVLTNSLVNGNIFNGNNDGLSLYAATNSTIADNDIRSNRDRGLFLFASANVTVSGNNVTDNNVGFFGSFSKSISVHHNNFVNNMVQTRQWASSIISWDDGFPAGGNFWSDYAGVDNCTGPDQSVCPNPDGIGDTARVVSIIDWCNDFVTLCVVDTVSDRYPLVSPFVSVVKATLDLDPNTIALRSKGKYFTAYIELASPHDLLNVDVSTIRLDGTIAVMPGAPATVADHNGNGIPDLTAKFSLADVKSLFTRPGVYTLQVTGHTIFGGRSFTAHATIRYIV